MQLACPICGNVAGNSVVAGVPEMQFGLGESFDYLQCAACGALSLLDVPQDMARYYPSEYYSLAPLAFNGSDGIKRLLKRWRTAAVLTLGSLARPFAPTWLSQLKGLGLNLTDAILDVGCGNGARLAVMGAAGFSNLHGIDPYISSDLALPGLSITKAELADVSGHYQLVMFHHSFEHMSSPENVLRDALRVLAPGGTILIRTPLADSYAFEHYSRHWAQLDAPRHIHVHTRRSLALLAQRAGLKLHRVECDSTAFQFWGSEQYQLGITLEGARSYLRHPESSPFKATQIADWERQARRLNAQGRGDQAALYLSRM